MASSVIFADFCECRQVLQTPVGDGSGATDDGNTLLEPKLGCPVDNLYIQELCNGTLASPCDCTGSSLECEVFELISTFPASDHCMILFKIMTKSGVLLTLTLVIYESYTL